jgi:hypothetical protein
MRIMRRAFILTVIAAAVAGTSPAQTSTGIPSPASVLGFQPGSDRQLMDYEQLIDYMLKLAVASDRVEMREVGTTPLGRKMYVAFISSADNITRLDELREINKTLALDPDIPAPERASLIERGRVFVMEALSMHSGEVAPSQSLPLYAYGLATTDDPAQLQQLDNVVLMMVPCHNPDGMDLVVEHYREYLGTMYEGSSLPRVYHKYIGHDNNRDFVALTQEDTQVISRLYSTEWYPQVLVEKHQMGSTGPRYFVPPNHDPIAQIIDEGLWNWSAVFGAALARDMTADGLQGVASHWVFDDYWPGSTETSHWKNIISFLTEAASCKTATPVFIEPTELKVNGKGLSEYKKGVNMLDPWPGGTWSLGDIVEYELSSMASILATAAANRDKILTFRNDLCRKEVEKGRTEPPYYFALPQTQPDPGELAALVELLRLHGIEVDRLTADAVVGDHRLHAGDFVVPLAQPYRPFVVEVMEAQTYPERHYTPDGELMQPYDITSWSLPLHMGVTAIQIDQRSAELEGSLVPATAADFAVVVDIPDDTWAIAYPASSNQSYAAVFAALGAGFEVSRIVGPERVDGVELPAGSFVIRAGSIGAEGLRSVAKQVAIAPILVSHETAGARSPVRMPRIALVETFFHDMDAGWTRYLFDIYGIPFRVLHPGDFDDVNLAREFDVIVFPDADKDVLTKGKYKRGDRYVVNDYPPEFREPISKKGLADLTAFIGGGGTVVSWGDSTKLFTDGLAAPGNDSGDGDGDTVEIPVSDITKGAQDVLVPGAFLAVDYLPGQPLTWGMPGRGGAFSRGDPILATSIPRLDTDRRVVAVYPDRDLLLSGYLEGEKELQNTPAIVWVRLGKGQLALFAIRPQFRGSTPATFKLVFNALLLPKLK